MEAHQLYDRKNIALDFTDRTTDILSAAPSTKMRGQVVPKRTVLNREKTMSRTATHDLLLHCLNEKPDESRLEQLSAPDWQDLMQQARRHAVLYLLYHRLKTQNLDAYIPADILQTVRAEYFECAWRNNRLYDDLAKILKALQSENIPVILLKGAHLAKIVYGNIALRPMGDIDILVRKPDLLKAEKALLALGYSSSRKDDIETACAKHQHLPPLLKQDSPPVELHWTLESPKLPFTIDVAALWRRAHTVLIGDIEALVLSHEDLVLHLCLHASYHHLYQNGLRAFCDIRETIRCCQDEIDWDLVGLRMREWGAGNSIYLTLYLAKSLLDADVPDDFLETYRPDSFTTKRATEIKEIIFNQAHSSISIVKLYRSMSVIEKAKFFLRRIFLSPEELGEKYNLPSSFRLIYYYFYLVRLKDVLVKYSRTVWRIWRKDEKVKQQVHLTDWLSR